MDRLGIGDAGRYVATARVLAHVRRQEHAPITSSTTVEKLSRNMAHTIVPHFHNEPGVPVIELGAREFMCIGAKPPFDHPHVFLDLGDAGEIVCPYCSTLYRFNAALDPGAARPQECAWTEPVA